MFQSHFALEYGDAHDVCVSSEHPCLFAAKPNKYTCIKQKLLLGGVLNDTLRLQTK